MINDKLSNIRFITNIFFNNELYEFYEFGFMLTTD